jgi:hypothetical protein
MSTDAPGASVPSEHAGGDVVHEPWLAAIETSVNPAGSVSLSATEVAASGPWLVTCATNRTVCPTDTVSAAAVFVTSTSAVGPTVAATVVLAVVGATVLVAGAVVVGGAGAGVVGGGAVVVLGVVVVVAVVWVVEVEVVVGGWMAGADAELSSSRAAAATPAPASATIEMAANAIRIRRDLMEFPCPRDVQYQPQAATRTSRAESNHWRRIG